MKTNLEMKNLESQVIECYSYFMNNYQNTNFDALEDMVVKLQKSMNLLTMTNIVNIIDINAVIAARPNRPALH